ncbi:MAG: carbohydrate ABC transporter permease [Thermomicrobiales bacterium]
MTINVPRRALLANGVLAIGAIATLLPFLWIFVTSLKFLRDIRVGGLSFEPTLVNYRRLFSEETQFLSFIGNSLIVAIIATTLAIVTGVPAAYSLARFRWPGVVTAGLLGWILVVHAIPPVTLSAPLFVLVRNLGLYDRLLGLALVHVVLGAPLVVWLMRGFFADLPREIEEASRVDGASRFQTFMQVALPLVGPGVATAGMLAFMVSWNEFLFAVTLTASTDSQTIPVGLSLQAQEYVVRYGLMSAGAVVATVPAILFVAFGQRRLIQGLTLGALKG